jgi:hypothetical protein
MHPHVARLLGLWSEAVRGPSRRLSLGGAFAALFGGAHLARVGTDAARTGAAALLAAVLIAWVVARIRRSLVERDLRRAIRLLSSGGGRELGERALRAVALADRAKVDPSRGSAELAELHAERLLTSMPIGGIRASAERRGARLQVAATVLAVAAAGSVAAGPLRVVEGLDVLAARRGVAPLPLGYLDEIRVEVHPPEYLRERDERRSGMRPMEAPYGSLITVRGVPAHAGRRLLLTDGTSEVPFVDDGAGGLLARWSVARDARLDVAARHGAVLIHQGEALAVRSIADQAPEVAVEGAPRLVRLLDESSIPLTYEATDDHGLREVDLVLRAGTREERRVLARLDGDTRRDTGGYQLRSTDRFLRTSFLPVEVTVEARDNDPLTGPKWGRSPAVTLLPPAIGEPEALRYEALIKARDALVDLLAGRVGLEAPGGKEQRAFAEAEAQRLETGLAPLYAAIEGVYGGLHVPRRFASFAQGQARKLREAEALEGGARQKRAPAGATGATGATGLSASPASPASPKIASAPVASGPTAAATNMLAATEGVVLAIDRAVRTLGTRDAQNAAKRLSRVASEAADGMLLATSVPAERQRGLARAQAALQVIEPSGKAIARLGVLGLDLGSIVANDLRRIRRALGAGDLLHAELAARDLAERLSRPLPSFMGGGRGQTESGNGGKSQQPADEGAEGEESGSDAEEGFGAEEQALQELARDHAGNIEDVQQSLRRAGESGQLAELLDEARRHGQAVRDAVSRLPQAGDNVDASPAASAREQAERMADALERGDLKEALEAGKTAQRSLDEALRAAEREPQVLGRPVAEANQKVVPEVKWTEESLERLRKALGDRANVGEAGDREGRLAEQARALLEKGRGASGALPGSSLDALQGAEQKMREAAKELQKGDADKALAHQREAQRMLDMAQPPPAPPGDASDDEGGGTEASGTKEGLGKQPLFGPANIPKAEEHKGPEDFRRRVVEGLKQGQPASLRSAIRRYAERLLR